MSDKKIPENVNSDRREFLEKVTKGAFVIPTVISVMMLNQKLNLTTANALSNLPVPCLSASTMISTPQGDIRVIDLTPGMQVYTTNADGHRVIEQLELVSKVSVPRKHSLYNLRFSGGKSLLVSGAHPMADGSEVQDLKPGTVLDGAELVSIEKVSYAGGYTYDLLPAGDTGCYWADGVLLGSTLAPESKSAIRKAV